MTHDLSDPNAWRASGVRRANRRRLVVFLSVLVTTSVIGQLWCFLRPPEYKATSRLQITPAFTVRPAESPASASGDSERPFLTEVQSLTSRPLIEQVAARLRDAGHDLSHLGVDPVLGLQATLTATPVTGTNVVEMTAVGPRPELPAALLIGISETYRDQIAHSYQDSTSHEAMLAAEGVTKLETAVSEKRRAVEAFQVRYGIVSPEREENSALAEMQGLAANMKVAQKRVSETEGKLSAVRSAVAEGKSVQRARDDPTLASLEQRASQARDALGQLERQFTPQYMEFDPKARSLRSSLKELESQIKVQREIGARNAVTEAEEELAGARASEAQLRSQIADDGRQRVGQFAARFSQFKSLSDDLKELEKIYQAAMQRKALLEATERARMPTVQVLEQAALHTAPWRPQYWRDAAFVLGGSLLFALLAMWLVELFNRSEPQPSVIVTQPVLAGSLAHHPHQTIGPAYTRLGALTVNETPLLTQAHGLPRELTVDECVALLRAADPATRCALALLLSGLSPDEAIALRRRDFDPANRVLCVGGAAGRTVKLATAATGLFERKAGDDDQPMLPGPSSGVATLESLAAQILCAAHDASLERVQEIGPAAVRHTYIAFLVRQGARFADLTRWVGPLDTDLLSAYSALAPAGVRLDGVSIRLDFPALDPVKSA